MKKQQGFTLLEILLAFSLLSLLFLGLFSSFHTAAKSWEVANFRMEKTSDRRLISEFLRRQLSQMMVVRIKDNEGIGIYAFEGDDRFVRFASPLQPFRDKGGIYLVELSAVSGKKGKTLELRYVPYRPELTWDDALREANPVLIYEGFKQVKFDYFGSENSEETPEWESEWLDQPHYPLLLKLTLRDQSGQSWPELLIDLPQVDEYVSPTNR